MAVDFSFGSGDISAGLVIATAIGLQNMPEGLVVALPLVREGYSRRKALWYGTLTGLVEPLGGLLGVAIVAISGFCYLGNLPSLLGQCFSSLPMR